MAEELTFGVTLEDHMSGPARMIGQSLSEMATHAEHGKSALTEMSAGFVKVIEPTEVLHGAIEGVTEGFKTFAEGLKNGEVKEMVSGIFDSLAGLAQMLDLIVPGLGQLASAAIKVGGAFASMTVGLIQAGAELSIEATQSKLAMIDMFAALGGGIDVGKETEEMLAGLSDKIGVTKDTLAPFTRAFMAMGIEGEEALKKVTLAAISAQAIMGDPSAAHAFETLTKKIQVAAQTGHRLKIPEKGLKGLADMGIRVDDVAKRMNVSAATLAAQLKAGTVNAKEFGDALQDALIDKGAGPLQRMGSSMASLKKMFGQNIEVMFEDMGKAIEPFIAAVKDMLSIFGQSTNSGKVMKATISGAFSFMFKEATKVVPYVKHFLQDLIIYSLRAYIAIKPIIRSFREIGDSQSSWLSLDATMHSITRTFGMIADAVIFSIQVLVGLYEIGQQLFQWAEDAYDIGKSFCDGLVNGITSGVASVVDAAKGLGAAAKKGLKDFLGIASPSKLMMSMGDDVGAGLASGIRGGVTPVIDASADLGAAAAQTVGGSLKADYSQAASGASAQGGANGGGAQMGAITINITAPNGVTNTLDLTEIAVAAIFERLQLQRGNG